jgi:hypothetical protein
MDGTTQTAAMAELRFDPTPSNTGVLIVLGDHSGGTARQTYQFIYDVPEKQPDRQQEEPTSLSRTRPR